MADVIEASAPVMPLRGEDDAVRPEFVELVKGAVEARDAGALRGLLGGPARGRSSPTSSRRSIPRRVRG